MACLNSLGTGFEVGKYLEAMAKSDLAIPELAGSHSKTEDNISGIIKHPRLIRRLREWRNNKAEESALPHYMILPQKTMLSIANLLPQSQEVLGRIKGMGVKTTDKYGDEIIDIVVSYCLSEKIEPEEVTLPAKREKKARPDTRKLSLDLFRQGKTVAQVAVERGLVLSTIEKHLEHYIERGEIKVNELVSQEHILIIMNELNGREDLMAGPVKEALGERVSWSEIHFVTGHMKYLRKAQSGS